MLCRYCSDYVDIRTQSRPCGRVVAGGPGTQAGGGRGLAVGGGVQGGAGRARAARAQALA